MPKSAAAISYGCAHQKRKATEMADLHESLTRPVPFPTGWAVRCPCCELPIEYEVEEDDSGAFGFDCTEIPICDACNVMFIPETVQVTVVMTINPLLGDEQSTSQQQNDGYT